MTDEAKTKALAALKRLKGLGSKVESMIENDEYCVDILTQVLAMQGHLKNVQEQILQSHLKTCAPQRLSSESDRDAFVEELVKAIGLSKR